MKPLEGLKILTVEHFGAGPYGTMFLAGLGAEVIKIENAATGGDASRHVGPRFLGDDDSEYFQTFNLWKKSVCLDLDKLPRVVHLKIDGGREAVFEAFAGIGLTFTRRVERLRAAFETAVEAVLVSQPTESSEPATL